MQQSRRNITILSSSRKEMLSLQKITLETMRTLDSVSHAVYREGERADKIEVLVAGLPLDQKVKMPWTVAWAKD